MVLFQNKLNPVTIPHLKKILGIRLTWSMLKYKEYIVRVGKQEEEATWIKGLDLEVDDEDVA